MNELPERLPSRPLRNWFLAWHIHTGDDADVIAQGFGLDPNLVGDFLSGEVPQMLPATEAVAISRRLRIEACRLWHGTRHQPESEFDWIAAEVGERLLYALSARR